MRTQALMTHDKAVYMQPLIMLIMVEYKLIMVGGKVVMLIFA